MVKEGDLLMLHVGGALYSNLDKVSSHVLLCTNYTPSGTTSPPNATATPPNATATPPNATATPSPVDCPHCLNGGTYVGSYCRCLAGYSGVYCEMAIYSPPGMYGKGHRFTCTGDVVNSHVCAYSSSLPLLFSYASLPSLLPRSPSVLCTLT